MNIQLKPGGGGQPQPYLSKGNGPNSGQYISWRLFYPEEEKQNRLLIPLSYLMISKFLLSEEIISLKMYTFPNFGKFLNKRIRENKLDLFDKTMIQLIKSATQKLIISNDCTIFRGISVDKNYFNELVIDYVNGATREGSLLCSTSLCFKRAFYGCFSNDKTKIPLIFKGKLLKGHHGITMHNISAKPNDEEILLFQPNYNVSKIELKTIGNFYYYEISINIKRS